MAGYSHRGTDHLPQAVTLKLPRSRETQQGSKEGGDTTVESGNRLQRLPLLTPEHVQGAGGGRQVLGEAGSCRTHSPRGAVGVPSCLLSSEMQLVTPKCT